MWIGHCKMQLEETSLVLSGSGANIIYELGAAAEIQKHMNIKTIYACSAGSIIGLAIAMGVDLTKFSEDIISRVGETTVYNGGLFRALYRLYKRGYMFDKDIRSQLLDIIFSYSNSNSDKSTINKKTKRHSVMSDKSSNDESKDITFKQLTVDLNIVATNCANSKRKVFSKQFTPDVRVIDAVMASSAIPIIYPTVFIDGEEYADGIFNNDYPYTLAPLENSIGIYIDVSKPIQTRRKTGFFEMTKKVLFLTRASLSDISSVPSEWVDKTVLCRVPVDNNGKFFEPITIKTFRDNFSFGSQQSKYFLKRITGSPSYNDIVDIIDTIEYDADNERDNERNHSHDGQTNVKSSNTTTIM